MEFYICKHCGNLITFIDTQGPPVTCCGDKMQRLEPNTVDAAKEKHVPVMQREGSRVMVSVGSLPHPMLQEHHIAWLALESRQGIQVKKLNPTGEPQAVFAMEDTDGPVAAYAYCNLHGLWKVDA